LSKISQIEEKINNALAHYDFPNSEKDIKKVLKNDLEKFLQENLQKIRDIYKHFLDDQVKLLNLELKKQEEIFNKIMSDYYDVYTYT
jgi:hypothetical protein